MLRKLILGVAILAGCLIGAGAWVFHLIVDRNLHFLTSHPWLSSIVGAGFLLMLAKAVYDTKKRNPRVYGLLALGIGCGIALHAIGNIPLTSPDASHSNFLLRLAAAVFLMVNGFGSLHPELERSSTVP
jgi:peptidoglycan/LPS O-acetylase OafA/YrhL